MRITRSIQGVTQADAHRARPPGEARNAVADIETRGAVELIGKIAAEHGRRPALILRLKMKTRTEQILSGHIV